MAKKRKRKSSGAKTLALLVKLIPLLVILVISLAVAGFVIFRFDRFGVWPGIAAGGGTAMLRGLIWLAAITYGEFSEGTSNHPIAKLGIIFVNGFVNLERCYPQMLTIALGLVVAVAGIVGWVMVSRANPSPPNQGTGAQKKQEFDPAKAK